MNRMLQRTLTTAGTTGAALALLVGSASAQECFVAKRNTNAPSSAMWESFTVAQAAGMFAGVQFCPAQVAAGESALRAEKLPLSVKFFAGDKTLAEKAQPKTQSDGKGMQHASVSEPYLFGLIGTYIAGGQQASCA